MPRYAWRATARVRGPGSLVSEPGDKTSELEERLAELEAFFDVNGLRGEAEDLGEEMSRPGFWDDPEEAKAVSARFSRVQGKISLLDGLRVTLSDSEELLELDEGDAILTINPGAGGVDSQDWAEMLARMYRRWAELRGFGLEVIEYTEA